MTAGPVLARDTDSSFEAMNAMLGVMGSYGKRHPMTHKSPSPEGLESRT